jgi:hypothetical protein
VQLAHQPSPITNVAATLDGPCAVVVTWDPPDMWTTSVGVFRWDSGSATGPIAVNPLGPFVDTDAVPGRQYQYQVASLWSGCPQIPTLSALVTGSRVGVAPLAADVRRVTPGSTLTLTHPSPGSSTTTYRWKRGGNNSTSAFDAADIIDGGRFSGANTPTLTITQAKSTDSEVYRCVMTRASNFGDPCIQVYSAPVIVPVICNADYNENGHTDIADIFLFLSDWFAGCP